MFNVFDRIIINQSSDESTLGYGLSQTVAITISLSALKCSHRI